MVRPCHCYVIGAVKINPITSTMEQQLTPIDKMLKQSTFAFTCQTGSGQHLVYKIDECVPTFFSASNSVVLSLAAYIAWKYPNLHHPDYMDYQLQKNSDVQQFPASDLSLHPLFEAWCDTLCHSIFNGHARRHNDTLYIVVPVPSSYSEELSHNGWNPKVYSEKPELENIFDVPKCQLKDKKVILMNFATSQLRENQLLPKINIPALVLGTIFDNEKWSFYCALKGEIPMKQQLVSADTIILPGSSNSVLDSIAPVDLFVSELKQAYEQNQKLKIMSICYGHQLVSRIHGAKIVRKNRFEGHETVGFNKKLTSKYGYLKSITEHLENEFVMPEHHEDYVETVPEGFDLIATSKSCFVEAMTKQDGRIFSLQFHPEYYSEYTCAFTARAKYYNTHYHLSFALDIEKQKLDEHHQSCDFVRLCIKEFINSEPVSTLQQS